jgi:hypothetical protein
MSDIKENKRFWELNSWCKTDPTINRVVEIKTQVEAGVAEEPNGRSQRYKLPLTL